MTTGQSVLRRTLFVLGLSILFLGACVPAHSQSRVPSQAVHVTHNGEDRLGNHLNFRLRKALRTSKAFTLSESRVGNLHITVATQAVSDTLTATNGTESVNVSVYTVTWLFTPKNSGAPVFLRSTMGYFQRKQVTKLAESIAGRTASLLSSIRARADS